MAEIYAYRNLRTGGFSIRQNGLVIDRVGDAILHGVTSKVSQAGRRLVLQRQQKEVHAFLVAQRYTKLSNPYSRIKDPSIGLPEIYYNPYTQDHFTVDGQPFKGAIAVLLTGNRSYLLT
jgi:hypothetical protein